MISNYAISLFHHVSVAGPLRGLHRVKNDDDGGSEGGELQYVSSLSFVRNHNYLTP